MRILLLVMTLAWSLFAQDDVKKVVYDFVTGDMKRFEQIVFKSTESHTTHYNRELKGFKAVFIIHGDAYRFFLKDLEGTPYAQDAELAAKRSEFASRLRALVENYDVTFEVCSFGLKSRNIPPEKLYDFVTPIFSATSGLIDWQERGHAYIYVK